MTKRFRAKLIQWVSFPLGFGLFFGAVANAQSEPQAPIANMATFVIGGAERRCSSFTGPMKGWDCAADWTTILAQDPAFKGIARERISFASEVSQPLYSYSLTAQHIRAFAKSPASLFDPERKKQLLLALHSQAQTHSKREALTWQRIQAQLPMLATAPEGQHTTRGGFTLDEQAVLRTALVNPQPRWQRPLEARSIIFSTNAHSKAITLAFVAAARAANGGKKPLIGVVTASASPHPFADHDLNVFALQSAGANVVYLPLDGGFRKALDANDCANLRYYYASYANTNPQQPTHHADQLYPDLAQAQHKFCENQSARLNATLGRLNGLLFTGGNQARHLESFASKDAQGRYRMNNRQLTVLQRRHAQGRLVLAGTSAGAHILGGGLWQGKNVSMIGGGDSYDALKYGFGVGRGPAGDAAVAGKSDQTTADGPVLYPLGGVGVFNYGVLDSHFSRRAREARLIRATHDSGMHYGFGVDENTALITSRADAKGTTTFGVLGAAGVFIADVRQARVVSAAGAPFAIDNVRAHFLRAGDTATLDAKGELQVMLNPKAALLPQRPAAEATPPVEQEALLDYGADNFSKLATRMGQQGAAQGFGTTLQSRDARSRQTQPLYSATLSREADTEFRLHAATGQDSTEEEKSVRDASPQQATVSYANLRIALAPCIASCTPLATPKLP